MNHVQEVAATFRGHFSLEVLADAVKQTHPELFAARAEKAWVNWCRTQVRQSSASSEALPFALSVDSAGTYCQLSFMDVDEFRFTIVRYMRQSRDSRRKAYRLADECERIHGVRIDPVEAMTA